jgi:polysaccharide export outer membrane protein
MFNEPDSTAIQSKIESLRGEYVIQPGDEISFKFYTRDGAALLEPIKTEVVNGQDISSIDKTTLYVVDESGFVNVPILGKYKVGGLTESKLKTELEKEFSEDYNSPYVVLSVLNRRAFLFKGIQGFIIPLNKSPMTIFEAIAKSGGIDRHISSSDITIIRGDFKSPKVYKLNLSTFKGIQNSEIMIQPNDIIYLVEKKRNAYYALTDIAPVVTLPLTIFSSLITTIFIIVTLTK